MTPEKFKKVLANVDLVTFEEFQAMASVWNDFAMSSLARIDPKRFAQVEQSIAELFSLWFPDSKKDVH